MITISFEVIVNILMNILRLVVIFETNSLTVRGIIHCVDLFALVIIVKFKTSRKFHRTSEDRPGPPRTTVSLS